MRSSSASLVTIQTTTATTETQQDDEQQQATLVGKSAKKNKKQKKEKGSSRGGSKKKERGSEVKSSSSSGSSTKKGSKSKSKSTKAKTKTLPENESTSKHSSSSYIRPRKSSSEVKSEEEEENKDTSRKTRSFIANIGTIPRKFSLSGSKISRAVEKNSHSNSSSPRPAIEQPSIPSTASEPSQLSATGSLEDSPARPRAKSEPPSPAGTPDFTTRKLALQRAIERALEYNYESSNDNNYSSNDTPLTEESAHSTESSPTITLKFVERVSLEDVTTTEDEDKKSEEKEEEETVSDCSNQVEQTATTTTTTTTMKLEEGESLSSSSSSSSSSSRIRRENCSSSTVLQTSSSSSSVSSNSTSDSSKFSKKIKSTITTTTTTKTKTTMTTKANEEVLDHKETEEVETSSYIVHRGSGDSEDSSIGSVIIPQDPMVEEEQQATQQEEPKTAAPQNPVAVTECAIDLSEALATTQPPRGGVGSKIGNSTKPTVPPLETNTIQSNSGSGIAASARSFIPSILSPGASRRRASTVCQDTRIPPPEKKSKKSGKKTMLWKLQEITGVLGAAKKGLPMFGMAISKVAMLEGNLMPSIVEKSIKYLEQHDQLEGLFRISGNQEQIQWLKVRFNKWKNVNLDECIQDPHVVAGILKMYFRELPEPLFTFPLHEEFIACVSGANAAGGSEQIVNSLKRTVAKLPETNKAVVFLLFKFLRRLSQSSSTNLMTPENLAIIFGPTLMRSREDTGTPTMAFMLQLNSLSAVVSNLITHHQEVFSNYTLASSASASAATVDVGSKPKSGSKTKLFQPSTATNTNTNTTTNFFSTPKHA
eukprot:TRINITY_DN2241_c0_g1_i1.p1 TRINITY_DN2241_c0_g1~~TRINITY_DN2241_c0_g1_i1.p1  ORF type:complete len:821 (+),score=270.47 TRINITY_DN2241_c0_g1_i1:633-3095(+)